LRKLLSDCDARMNVRHSTEAIAASSRRTFSLILLLGAWGVPIGPVVAQPLSDGLSVTYKSPPAPRLALQGLDEKTYDLADYRGRVVVVNFWATWCPPCIEEMPTLQRMWEKLSPSGLELFAVNLGEKRETITAFLVRFEPQLTFPILLDQTGEAFEAWRIRGLPKTYVIGKQGRVIYEAEGGRDMDSEHIRGLLKALIDK
jgi:thiol-disulfide isomerase/thioredoxin